VFQEDTIVAATAAAYAVHGVLTGFSVSHAYCGVQDAFSDSVQSNIVAGSAPGYAMVYGMREGRAFLSGCRTSWFLVGGSQEGKSKQLAAMVRQDKRGKAIWRCEVEMVERVERGGMFGGME
jgi:hypothetical protein